MDVQGIFFHLLECVPVPARGLIFCHFVIANVVNMLFVLFVDGFGFVVSSKEPYIVQKVRTCLREY